MKIQAVIFDMDGLLVDSEGIGLTVMQDCAARQGVNLPAEAVRQTLGTTTAAAAAFYRRTYPAIDTDALFADFSQEMHELARSKKSH